MFSVKELAAVKDGNILCAAMSVDFNPRELTAIVGPNGAGKSSFIKAMLGDIPAVGHATLGGVPLIDLSLTERARQIAVLPQESHLAFPFTVREVMTLGRLPHASGESVDRNIVEEVAERLELGHMMNFAYTRLSGGEKQRVNLARCLVQIWRREDAESRVLILDEPTSALDLAFQDNAMQSVRYLAEDGVAALIVLHDLNLALRFCDRMIVMHAGSVVADGKPCDVLTSALLKDVFRVNGSIVKHADHSAPTLILS